MINMYVGGTIGALVLGVLLIGWWFASRKPRKKVCVVLGRDVASHLQAYEAFKEELLRQELTKTCSFDTYLLDLLDKSHVIVECNAVLSAKPDLIVSFGTLCTYTLKRCMDERRMHDIPLVFLSVFNPVGGGIIKSFEEPGGCITGVQLEGAEHAQIAAVALLAKPAMRCVLLPYEVLSDLDGRIALIVDEMQQFFHEHGIRAEVVPVYGVKEVATRLEKMLDGADTLIISEMDGLTQVTTEVARLCSAKGVTFVCATRDGAELGAAVAFVADTNAIGKKAVDLIHDIVVSRRRPGGIPIAFVENTRTLFINKDAATQQNCPSDLDALRTRVLHDPRMSWLQHRIKLV